MNRITLFTALFSVALAAAGWSQQETSKAQAPSAEPTPAPTVRTVVSTQTIQSEAPTGDALIMVRDAETGQLRAATAAERASLLSDVDPLNRSDAGLTKRYYADGTVGVRLNGRFQSFSTVHRVTHDDGAVEDHAGCSTDAVEAIKVGAALSETVTREEEGVQ